MPLRGRAAYLETSTTSQIIPGILQAKEGPYNPRPNKGTVLPAPSPTGSNGSWNDGMAESLSRTCKVEHPRRSLRASFAVAALLLALLQAAMARVWDLIHPQTLSPQTLYLDFNPIPGFQGGGLRPFGSLRSRMFRCFWLQGLRS